MAELNPCHTQRGMELAQKGTLRLREAEEHVCKASPLAKFEGGIQHLKAIEQGEESAKEMGLDGDSAGSPREESLVSAPCGRGSPCPRRRAALLRYGPRSAPGWSESPNHLRRHTS